MKKRGLQLYYKETLAQVFSSEFCEISKNTFFYRTLLVAASEHTFFIGNVFYKPRQCMKFLTCFATNSI